MNKPLLGSMLRNLALCAAFAASAKAQTKTIDVRRNITPGGPLHYVIFASRGGSPTGHAYVIWRDIGVGPALHDRAFGLYPKDRSTSGEAASFAPVDGELRDDSQWIPSQMLVVQVDQGQWDASESRRDAYTTTPPRSITTPSFMLGAEDCVSFVMDIGLSFDLAMPDRSILNAKPSAYIDQLITDIDKSRELDLGNGNSYKGQTMVRRPNYIKQLYPYGKGTYTSGKGTVLSGDFRYGVVDGEGKYVNLDGTGFEGKFVSGNPVQGTWRNKGWTYSGALAPHGGHAKARLAFDNGDTVDGQWGDMGGLDGPGFMYFATPGITISGNFINSKYSGRMSVLFNDGAKATVDMQTPDRLLQGAMTYTTADGKWTGKGFWSSSGEWKVNGPPRGGTHSERQHSGAGIDRPGPHVTSSSSSVTSGSSSGHAAPSETIDIHLN